MEKSKSGIICILKNIERGLRNPFSKSAQTTKKVLIRQKKCSNDNLKSAQTTIFIKRCISTEKVFVIFWALNGIYYLWRRQR